MDKDLLYINKGGGMMERLTNIGTNGEMWITDNDETRRFGRKESAYKKLAEYEDLEEHGLLLRLPCKVGDAIYRVNAGAKEPVIKMRVLQVHYKELHKNRIIIRIDAINDKDMGESCYLLEDFGKTVFLTKAEAKKKLKEMESD